MNVNDLRKALSYNQLTVRHLAILLAMRDAKGKVFLKDLATFLDVQRPVITRSWDALGRLGMIKRLRDEGDRRNVSAFLTEKGKQFTEGLQ